ncbi:hypothetical protein EYR40_007023 [Pleurotus pulmonarius]|nr:hypothetical protein EYR36_003701 [Pleurotus pulmonarius]KAF4599919.1 hypothetical protein EYR40_007023 [Pleurotus pulmonarius]
MLNWLSAFLPANLVLLNVLHSEPPFHSNQAPLHAHHRVEIPLGDPAGHPNTAVRFELTANRTTFASVCARAADVASSGYVHLTNNRGEEDKHMFWWLFEARHDPENAPIVLSFGGGPGGSGQLFPFSGAGPCQVHLNDDGTVEAVPSPYSWTEHVNLLAIDHPVGVGFSYGNPSSLRNSSERAAWDVDDFLQAFWRPTLSPPDRVSKFSAYPHLAKWFYESNCHSPTASPPPEPVEDSDANTFFNATVCADILHAVPPCLDAIQLAYEQPARANRYAALEACVGILDWGRSERNPYDAREECPGGCQIDLGYLDTFMNSEVIRNITGVPKSVHFKALELDTVGLPFILNGDQCMKLLKTKHQSAFQGAAEVAYPGVGTIRTVGASQQSTAAGDEGVVVRGRRRAGDYALVKVREAGHMVILSQPALVRHMMKRWLDDEGFF